ncbi:MAG: hypothetical protein ABI411_15165 [Tahibacter sp.]
MPSIALVTAKAAEHLDEDMAPLRAALIGCGAKVEVLPWDDTSIDWQRFDLALLRSTWDYTTRLPEFLAWAERTSASTTLCNPLEVVRWNTDKHYLAELARAGVATVPSAFIEPGDSAQGAIAAFLDAHPDASEFVVKPAIGAGSRDAQRYHRADLADATLHAEHLLSALRSVLLQPYLGRVDAHGETSLIHFAGRYSHAIRKGPLLTRKAGPVRALFAAEHIGAREPTPEQHALAERTLAAIPFASPLLYARIDLLQDADNAPRLLELELTEPSLFFAHGPGSAQRCALAVIERALR